MRLVSASAAVRLLVGVHCILVVFLTGVLTRRVLVTVTLVAGVIFQLTTTASFVTSTEFLVVAPMEISVALVSLIPTAPSIGLVQRNASAAGSSCLATAFPLVITASALIWVSVEVTITARMLAVATLALLGRKMLSKAFFFTFMVEEII